MTAVVAALLAGCALAVVPRARPSPRAWAPPATEAPTDPVADSVLRRHRVVLALLAAVGGVSLVAAPWGWVAGPALAAGVWALADRAEPPGVRRMREQARRELPHVVQLLELSMSAGASLGTALRIVEDALPGPATGHLRAARSRLDLGVAPAEVWSDLARRPELAELGRTLARAQAVGAPPAAALGRLAVDLADRARADVEDQARAVGIRAALPLGVCLLPAFLLLGIVPLVVSALTSLHW